VSTSITPLELRGITRRFGRNLVLRDVELELRAGEIVGLMGANGSGKTTLFSIIAGLLAPDGGERRFGGRAPGRDELELRARLAYVAHATQLYPLLTGRENLELFARLREAIGATSRPSAEILERLGLAAAMDRPVSTYSRGMAQRVVLARAVATSPEVMLLDEPFTALDRHGRAQLAELLREERDRGAAILLSSHDVDSIADIADRVLLLEDGVIGGTAERTEADDFRRRVAALSHLTGRPVGAAPQLA
jgi:heme ABC exporter ATP-binding subunit CcmA